MVFEPTHSHSQGGGVTHRITGTPKRSLSSFKHLNVSFFELSAWYSHVHNADIYAALRLRSV